MQACEHNVGQRRPALVEQWAISKAGTKWIAQSQACGSKQRKYDGFEIKRPAFKWAESSAQQKAQISEVYHRLASFISEHQSESRDVLETEFHALAAQWKKETGMISMVHKKAIHPAYQRIIGMGKDALPLILKELQERGGHWIWALRSISGIDAALPHHNLRQATEAWLAWGRKNGYL